MSEILQKLHATGKQIIVASDLYKAGFLSHLTPQGFYIRLAQLPEGERPQDHGGFNAGGRVTWASPEAAAAFAEHHLRYWAERMTTPIRKRNAA